MSNTENESTPADLIDPGDELENESPAISREQEAFSAPPLMWKDIAMAPFAVDREGDWLLHRSLMGAPPLNEIIEDVGAMALDAMRVLWFCAQDPDEWNSPARDAEKRAAKIEHKIREWARLHIAADEIPASVSLFYQIYSRAHSTRPIIVSDGKGPGIKN